MGPGIFHYVLPIYHTTILLKQAVVVNSRHPDLYCWYSDRQEITESNMTNARSNKLKFKKKKKNSLLSVQGLFTPSTTVWTQFRSSFTHSRSDLYLINTFHRCLLTCYPADSFILSNTSYLCQLYPIHPHKPIWAFPSAPSSPLLNWGGSPQISVKQLWDMLAGSCKNRFIIFRPVLLRSSQISFWGVEWSLLSRYWRELKMMQGHKNTLVWAQSAEGPIAVM